MNSVFVARIYAKLKNVEKLLEDANETVIDIKALLINIENENRMLNLEIVSLKSESLKSEKSNSDKNSPITPENQTCIYRGNSFDLSSI